MQIPFSDRPGRHERHLRRRLDNPLFEDVGVDYTDADLLEAQRRDYEELQAFIAELRRTVQDMAELQPNEESDVILDLKERLERLYETASGLGDEQQGNKDAIRRLVAVIMKAVRASAAGDRTAEQELDEDDLARGIHFQLLQYPIVADLLHPETAIVAQDLASTLLMESAESLAAALRLFDARQLALLCADARRRLTERDAGHTLFPEPWQRLVQMESHLAQMPVADAPH